MQCTYSAPNNLSEKQKIIKIRLVDQKLLQFKVYAFFALFYFNILAISKWVLAYEGLNIEMLFIL